MSAWSSATGKAQLSYAERLRQANKPAAPTSQDPSSSASAQRSASQDAKKSSASHDATASPSNRSATGASTAASARTQTVTADVKVASAAHDPAVTPAKSAGPAVNVWEARRKQLAEKEADKERERQATLAQQRKASTVATPSGSAGNNASSTANRGKQAAPANNANAPKKGNERHSKGPFNSSQNDRKNIKQANQPPSRQPNSVSISSSASSTTTAPPRSNAQASSSKANNAEATPKSLKERGHTAEDVNSTNKPQQSSADQTAQAIASNKTERVDQSQKAEDKPSSSEPSNPALSEVQQPKKASTDAQNASAMLPPSNAMTINTAPAPIALHDDVPASPATVTSAIEEVLKKGGVNGAQTEDDDAWLARIHLLNGGQNMPNFGGFGPNGISSLEDEAELQAAKKAERAVAAAWGAGKSVWNKTQQPKTADGKDPISVPKSLETHTAKADAATNENESTTDNGGAPQTSEPGLSGPQKHEKPIITDKAHKTDLPTQSKKSNEEKAQQSKSSKPKAASTSTAAAATLPSFEDVNNWPSPLDAGKKTTEKPRPAANANSADPETKPKQTKSFYETLDELQLRLAPGASAQQGGSAGAVKKGGKQWVPILPEIMLTTGQAGGKGNKQQGEGKGGKGAGKQQRKDGGKQGEKNQGQKKEKEKDKEEANKASGKTEKAQAKGESKTKGEKGGAQGEGQSRAQTPARSAESIPATGDAATADSTATAQKPAETNAAQEATPSKQPRSGRVGRQPQAHLPPSGANGFLPPAPNGMASPALAGVYASQPPVYYASSPVAPMISAPWLPYYPTRNATPPYIYDSTPQTGSPLPPGALGQLLAQTEFYFSEQNLVGDFFLRSKMDRHGWVDVAVVAGFKRVRQIVSSEPGGEKKGEGEMVMDALKYSAVLEVDAENQKVRRRLGWQLYVLPSESEAGMEAKQANEDDEPALGVVAASGFGGALNPDQ